MGFYRHCVLPMGIHLACGVRAVRKQREKIVPRAEGTVLEIGIGSGHNLSFYDPARVRRVIGIDPSQELREMAGKSIRRSKIPVELVPAGAEEMPLDDCSVDTVLVTYSLCSIPDPVAALVEARRVLRPGGRLLFCEHGEAPDEGVRRWQRRFDSFWPSIAGGCHLARPIPRLIEQAGWRIEDMETGYISPPRILGFNYWGAAKAG